MRAFRGRVIMSFWVPIYRGEESQSSILSQDAEFALKLLDSSPASGEVRMTTVCSQGLRHCPPDKGDNRGLGSLVRAVSLFGVHRP